MEIVTAIEFKRNQSDSDERDLGERDGGGEGEVVERGRRGRSDGDRPTPKQEMPCSVQGLARSDDICV